MLPPLAHEDFIERTIRDEWGRILASLNAGLRDLDLAEDSLQDAVEAAIHHWKDGLPKSPAAWLIATAKRKAIDRIRRNARFHQRQQDIADVWAQDIHVDDDEVLDKIPDARLELMFTCCHPSLAEKTQIALTLRTIAGLHVDEIARAFLDDPKTIAQRLTRAKKKIKLSGIPYHVPERGELPARLKTVLGVVYLIFNEGYAASSGEQLVRIELIQDAIRLARILNALLPAHPEIEGLLALMLLSDARRFARLDSAGNMVALEHQNRNRWDQPKIQEGAALVDTALRRGEIGPYQLQAAISALHCQAKEWAKTDWPQILGLYDLLYRMQPTSVVAVNRAVSVSYAQSVDAGISALADAAEQHELDEHLPYFVARADMLLRAGQADEGRQSAQSALRLVNNDIERRFIEMKFVDVELKP